VIYSSKSGNTKKLAEWIADDLNSKAVPVKDINLKDLSPYDTIIYGGGLYMSKIDGIKFIKKNLKKLEGKRIIVFASGLTENEPTLIREMKEKNFTNEELGTIMFFYIKGSFNLEKLPFKERMMMKMVKKMMKEGEDLKDDERMLLDALNGKVDDIDRKNIIPLIQYVKGQ
jgi:menaquinone-dependent protoporphyrinogen IX oxidase